MTTIQEVSVLKVNQKEDFLNRRHLELTKEDPISNVNCTKIIEGDIEEIQKVQLEALSVSFKKRPRLTTDDYINMTADCASFTKTRKYIMEPLSNEEAEFPIAYSIVVYHKIEMLDRLLRSIYTPQNFYCIHVDKKSPESFFAAVKGIVSCFDNVFISSQLESVVYASWSRVQADINCMKDLYRRSSNWKYLINLCGMDFPIKTNQEIVEKLKALKGENSLETEKCLFIKNAYFVVSRSFVEYVLENSKILKFIEWAKDTYSPDEYLWATIQRIPEVPGAFSSSDKYDVSDMNALARRLELDATKPPLIANKFDTDVDPFAVKCLEEYLRHKALYLQKN
ncbi:hypothetical protein DUI87_03862 [Hirundo rustica rustica]|uniref:Protein xylosyltransferase n=1 Tax=Hirundo rustica rustica TaxID=333673 RepID=A0A3M0L2E1_HIRRU|nr:hypothetical protein DUI87_03862 [Hirundo rustica rustica]